MKPEDILEQPATRLNQAQREQYFSDGSLTIPNAIPNEWLDRLRVLSDQFLDASRRCTASDNVFDLGPNHSPETPHVRRVKALVPTISNG
jgi:phytanoyl-CoA hydroxylase